MRRQNRWSVRISFLLVILMGFAGVWYVNTVWMPVFNTIDLYALSEGIDWVTVASDIGEQAVQLLLGATSTN